MEDKFKLWSIEEKCFVGSYSSGILMDPCNGQLYIGGMNVTSRYKKVRYTGLKDKNGNEIYEGDILRCKVKDKLDEDYNYLYKYINNIIEWWESATKHEYRLRNGKFTMMLKKLALSTMEAEIIGNIYENPELLKSA